MQKTDTLKLSGRNIKRILWSKSGEEKGPVLVIFVGIHGNEPAGIRAVENISKNFYNGDFTLKGTIYTVTGNLKALKLGIRYLDKDLNRMWESDYTEDHSGYQIDGEAFAELDEILAIKNSIESIIKKHETETNNFIFTDIHTTSSNSCAFIPFNDTLENRELARKFPVPQILGIEEYIGGTLLSYINNLGFKAIGFEAGAHSNAESIQRSEAFIWLVLHYCGIIQLPLETVKGYETSLKANLEVVGMYYEIIYHHFVEDPEKFDMIGKFKNFDPVNKNQPLAYENGELIESAADGRIFMPLYQRKGSDGFFIIREISPVWLRLSAYFRKSSVHKFLKYLPGVKPLGRGNFEVDLKRARFMVKQLFHLFGYRLIRKDKDTHLCYRR